LLVQKKRRVESGAHCTSAGFQVSTKDFPSPASFLTQLRMPGSRFRNNSRARLLPDSWSAERRRDGSSCKIIPRWVQLHAAASSLFLHSSLDSRWQARAALRCSPSSRGQVQRTVCASPEKHPFPCHARGGHARFRVRQRWLPASDDDREAS
jgi:hypothetical protein